MYFHDQTDLVIINAPQQCGEPDDTYHRHCDAAVQLHHVTFERTQSCLDPNQACHFDDQFYYPDYT